MSKMPGMRKEFIQRESDNLIPTVDADFLDDDSDEADETIEAEIVADQNTQSARKISRGAKIKNFKLGRNLKVFVGTWNMGNKRGERLDYFLPMADGDFDIIAIGLQESTYSVGDAKDASQGVFDACIAHLSQEFTNILGSQYYIVKHVKRAQLQLYIFAKKVLKTSISDINWSAENTGFLHVFPNKGGLCVTFKIDGTTLAFISCHLTAHEGQKNCTLRNASTKEILGGVRAGDKRFDVSVQFHHTFWMGDMNYRLDLGESNSKRDNSPTRKTTAATTAAASTATAAGVRGGKGGGGGGIGVKLEGEDDSKQPLLSIEDKRTGASSSGKYKLLGSSKSERIQSTDSSSNRQANEKLVMSSSVFGKSIKRRLGSEGSSKPPMSARSDKDRDQGRGSERGSGRGSGGESDGYSTPTVSTLEGNTEDIFSVGDAIKSGNGSRFQKLKYVLDLIAEERWSDLLALDELERELREGRVLGGFKSLKPNFPPTFKRIRQRVIQPRKDEPTATVSGLKFGTASGVGGGRLLIEDTSSDNGKSTGTGTGTGTPGTATPASQEGRGEKEKEKEKKWCLSTKGNNNLHLGKKSAGDTGGGGGNGPAMRRKSRDMARTALEDIEEPPESSASSAAGGAGTAGTGGSGSSTSSVTEKKAVSGRSAAAKSTRITSMTLFGSAFHPALLKQMNSANVPTTDAATTAGSNTSNNANNTNTISSSISGNNTDSNTTTLPRPPPPPPPQPPLITTELDYLEDDNSDDDGDDYDYYEDADAFGYSPQPLQPLQQQRPTGTRSERAASVSASASASAPPVSASAPASAATSGRSGDQQPQQQHCPPSKVFYDHKRIPSYTDRILYRSLPGFVGKLIPLFFESCEKVPSSDHKPVIAGFILKTVGGGSDIVVHKDDRLHIGAGKRYVEIGHKDAPKLELILDNLSGSNLAEMDSAMFGGGSDPYIVITSDPPFVIEKSVRSSIILHNINPVWTDKLTVKFVTADLMGLSRNAHLIISVWDKDRMNADDLIGVCSIPLTDIIYRIMKRQGEDDQYVIHEELLNNGDHNGVLEGRIRIAGHLEDIDRSLGSLALDEASMVKLDDISTVRETRLSQIASIGKKGTNLPYPYVVNGGDRDSNRESRNSTRGRERGKSTSDKDSDKVGGVVSGSENEYRDDSRPVGGGGGCCTVA